MALNNKLRTMVDQPVWEWMRYSPFASAATNTLYRFPAAATGSRYNRYIYASTATTMYSYDTFSDSWNTWGTLLPNSPVSTIGGGWDLSNGHYGYMISATSGSNTAVGAFINESSVVGQKIKIISGLGVGQEKTIVSSSQPVNVEYLTPTAAYTNTATTIGSITDTTKKWVPNQWRGYQVRAYLGTSQQYFVRRILYNNNDTLFFANAEWHAIDPNQAYNHVYDGNALAVGTATRCVIQSDTITVDSPWNTNLDYSSKFEIEVGSLVSIQNISTGGLFLAYRYDPLYANWFPLHAMSGVMPTFLAGTTLSFEPLSAELVPDFITGSLTSGSVRLAQDTTQNWKVNQWTNYRFVNTTNGLEKTITSNNTNTLFFASDCDILPSGSNTYKITVDGDKSYIAGGNFASVGQFSNRTNSFSPSQRLDDGVVNVALVRASGSKDFEIPVSSITRVGAVATVTTVTGHPFTTGDRVFISGALGADSTFYNGTFTVTSSYPLSATLTGTSQPTAFTYGMSGTPSGNATLLATSTTLIVDTSKNWITNEHVGRVYRQFSSSPTAPTVNYSRITANTSQSLTLATAATNPNTGVWGYGILSDQAFGASYGLDTGITTGTSSLFVTASTVSGQPFLFLSASQLATLQQVPIGSPATGSASINAVSFFRSFETSSNGLFITASLSANATATTSNAIITFSLSSSRGFGTATGGTSTTLVDTTKNWPTNFWVGAQIRFLAGTGVGQETTISSNTNNTITFSATNTSNGTTATPDTTTVYSILPVGRRNTTSTTVGAAGSDILWIYGRESGSTITPTEDLGKYIWMFEAASTMRFAKYNIATMMYEYPVIQPFSHQTNFNLTTGTYYAYDGKNRIYIQPNISAQFLYIDTDREISDNASTLPAGNSTARESNKMVLKTSNDGLDFLYYMRQNDTPFFRMLMFF
jgi:hypothetical protein